MRLLLAAVAIAMNASRLAHAQAFSTDDAVLRRIWTAAMDSSQTYPLGQALLDSVGPRLTGTPGQKAANQWLLSKYRSWGIDAREESYGTWRGWRRGITHVDLLQPRVRSLEAIMLAWPPPCCRKTSYPVTPTLSDDGLQLSWTLLDVTFAALGWPGVVGAWVSPGLPPPFTVAENELTPRPTPPIHGSKPPWMLVRYHDRVIAPRLMMSLMKSSVLKLQLLIGDGAT